MIDNHSGYLSTAEIWQNREITELEAIVRLSVSQDICLCVCNQWAYADNHAGVVAHLLICQNF